MYKNADRGSLLMVEFKDIAVGIFEPGSLEISRNMDIAVPCQVRHVVVVLKINCLRF
jgi:hypothetical protein